MSALLSPQECDLSLRANLIVSVVMDDARLLLCVCPGHTESASVCIDLLATWLRAIKVNADGSSLRVAAYTASRAPSSGHRRG